MKALIALLLAVFVLAAAFLPGLVAASNENGKGANTLIREAIPVNRCLDNYGYGGIGVSSAGNLC